MSQLLTGMDYNDIQSQKILGEAWEWCGYEQPNEGEMNECSLKRDHFNRENSLPTRMFQGTCYFRGSNSEKFQGL